MRAPTPPRRRRGRPAPSVALLAVAALAALLFASFLLRRPPPGRPVLTLPVATPPPSLGMAAFYAGRQVGPLTLVPEPRQRGAAGLVDGGAVPFAVLTGAEAARYAASHPTARLAVVALLAERSLTVLLWRRSGVFHWRDVADQRVAYLPGTDLAPFELLLSAYGRGGRRLPVHLVPTSAPGAAGAPFLLADLPYGSGPLVRKTFHPAVLLGAELGPYPAFVLAVHTVFARRHPLLTAEVIGEMAEAEESLRAASPAQVAARLGAVFPDVGAEALTRDVRLAQALGAFPSTPLPEEVVARMAVLDPQGPWRALARLVDGLLARRGWQALDRLPW